MCGLTNRADTAAAVAAGADALGFVLVPSSPRFISVDIAAELIKGVDLTTFLLTHDLDPETAIAAVLATGATGIQPYGRFAAEAAQAGVESGLMVLRPVGPGEDWQSVPVEQYPLFDSKRSDGTAGPDPSDFDHLPPADRPFVVAGGLNPDTVRDIVRTHRPFGVDVSSGVEVRPGQKDHALVSAFVEAVRGAG